MKSKKLDIGKTWHFLKTRRSKAAHETYLQLIGRTSAYFLFGFLTLVLTFLVFYRSKGYYVNRDGEVTGRGIILVDSAPVSAQVIVDGKKVGNTDKKIELDEGSHLLEIKKEGYKTWSREFKIKAEEVRWFYYPYLIAEDLEVSDFYIFELSGERSISNLNSKNQIATIEWGENQDDALNLGYLEFSLYDFNRYDSSKELEENLLAVRKKLIFPSQLFSVSDSIDLEQYKFFGWSSDGEGALVWHSYIEGGVEMSELVRLDFNEPLASINLSRSNLDFDLGLKNLSVEEAQARVQFDEDGSLLILAAGEVADYNPGNLKRDRTLAMGGVTSFKYFGDGYLMFSAQSDYPLNIQDSLNPLNQAIFVQNGDFGTTSLLKIEDLGFGLLDNLGNPRGSSSILDMIDYSYTVNRRSGYVVIADMITKDLRIYKNLISSAKDMGDSFVAKPIETFKFDSEANLRFEHNDSNSSTQPGTYFFITPSDKEVFVYNFEKEMYYRYGLTIPERNAIVKNEITDAFKGVDKSKRLVIKSLRWLDAERLEVVDSLGDIYYMDYDGNYLNLIDVSNAEQKVSYFMKNKDASVLTSMDSGLSGFSILNFKH